MNGVSVYGFMGNPVIDPLLYIIFSVGYCEITFAPRLKVQKRQLVRFCRQSTKPTEA